MGKNEAAVKMLVHRAVHDLQARLAVMGKEATNIYLAWHPYATPTNIAGATASLCRSFRAETEC
jgi:hypothetical protein